MDLRAPAGTPVYAPVSGRVRLSRYRIDAGNDPRRFVYSRDPFQMPVSESRRNRGDVDRYLEIALTDEKGRTWMLRHVDPNSVPLKVRQYAEHSDFLPAGEHLGNIVAWHQPVTPQNQMYDHVHFEVIDGGGQYLNPLLLLPPRPDTLPPQIGGIWFCADESEKTFPTFLGIPRIRGHVDLIVEASDVVDNLGYLVLPHRIKYAIDQVTESGFAMIHPEIEVYQFDRLPVSGDRSRDATVIFKNRLKTTGSIVESHGNAIRRRFLLVLTNGTSFSGFKPERCWETRLVPNGRYRLTVTAYDLAGNTTRREQLFDVLN
jgi:hypothetical protein